MNLSDWWQLQHLTPDRSTLKCQTSDWDVFYWTVAVGGRFLLNGLQLEWPHILWIYCISEICNVGQSVSWDPHSSCSKSLRQFPAGHCRLTQGLPNAGSEPLLLNLPDASVQISEIPQSWDCRLFPNDIAEAHWTSNGQYIWQWWCTAVWGVCDHESHTSGNSLTAGNLAEVPAVITEFCVMSTT